MWLSNNIYRKVESLLWLPAARPERPPPPSIIYFRKRNRTVILYFFEFTHVVSVWWLTYITAHFPFRIHHNQITSNQMLLPTIDRLRDSSTAITGEYKVRYCKRHWLCPETAQSLFGLQFGLIAIHPLQRAVTGSSSSKGVHFFQMCWIECGSELACAVKWCR